MMVMSDGVKESERLKRALSKMLASEKMQQSYGSDKVYWISVSASFFKIK